MIEAQLQEIEIYVAPDGKAPFSSWLEGLRDARARARIRIRIERLRLGNFGDCRTVGGGLFELRVDYGPGYRVYFGRVGLRLVILICGGDKQSQQKDIARAREFWSDYRSRE